MSASSVKPLRETVVLRSSAGEQPASAPGLGVGPVVELGQQLPIGIRTPDGAEHDEVEARRLEVGETVGPIEAVGDRQRRVRRFADAEGPRP